MDYIIYDCEIIRCIPGPNGERKPGLQYCDGWGDHSHMGISVIGTVDGAGITQAFLEPSTGWKDSPFQSFIDAAKQEGKIIVGFNSLSFDDNFCKANGINISTDFDLLREVRIAAYGTPEWADQPKGSNYSLAAITAANGAKKTGHGATAPELWQAGKRQEVIDYCINDCLITRQMLELFLRGQLIDPNTGSFLSYKVPYFYNG